MEIKFEESRAIVGASFLNVNSKEMRQMYEMKERIAAVLNSHKGENLKKEYLSDEELSMLHAILHAFTKGYVSITQTSAFDDALEELKNL